MAISFLLLAGWGLGVGEPVSASPARPGASADTRQGDDDAVMQALDRSEVGDVEGLQAARANTRDPSLRAVIDVAAAAARSDLRSVRAARRTLVSGVAAPRWQAITLAVEAGVAFARGDYPLASRNCAGWLALPVGTDPLHSRADVTQMAVLASQLASLPPQSIVAARPGSASTWRDKARLVRAMSRIVGHEQEAVLDTGANLSVVSESTARRLGLKVIEGGSVRSSTSAAVPTRLAVADRVDFAGTTLSNVVFLVLKDADLNIPLPGGYSIPAIIGLPVLRELGRVSFKDAALVVDGPVKAGSPRAPLVASGSDLYVPVRVNGVNVPLHLDSGAARTGLGARFAEAHPEVMRGLEVKATRQGGAGGMVEGSAHVLNGATVEVAGVRTVLPAVDIETGDKTGARRFGTLGQDVLRAEGGGYTMDFRNMTLSIERPGAPSRQRATGASIAPHVPAG